MSEERILESVSLATCLKVISFGKKQTNETISKTTKLSIAVIETIRKYKEHIQRILAYVPNAIRFITPNELNNIIAITEILMEFMRRLRCYNLELTVEELMANAQLLTSVFRVTDMHIDKNWAQFLRKNLQKTNSTRKPIEKIHKVDFNVQYILQHIQNMLDSDVVARFNEHLKKYSKGLILTCLEMLAPIQQNISESNQRSRLKKNVSITLNKIDVFKENQQAMTDNLEKEDQELAIKEEPNLEEYEVHESCINEIMNRLSDDDEIEIYAVIDEDDNENDGILMDVNQETEKSVTNTTVINRRILGKIKKWEEFEPVDETEHKIVQESETTLVQIKVEPNEFAEEIQDAMDRESELILDKIKKEPVDENPNTIVQESELILVKIKKEPNEHFEEIQDAMDQESEFIKDEHIEEFQTIKKLL